MALNKWKERWLIHQRAKAQAGLQFKQSGKREFMRVCMDQMMQDGDAEDEGEARDICEQIWFEGEELFED
jgi:hypothetical protein